MKPYRQPSFFEIENKREEVCANCTNKKCKCTESLTDKVNNYDKHMEKETGQSAEIFAFQKTYNPLVFYCRLRDLGFNKKCAMDLANAYESEIYDFIDHEFAEKYK